MKVTTEPLEKCQVLMTIEVDDAQADQLLKAAAKRISTQVQIPGFRPGKAPYSLIVRRFGEEVIREEALEDLSGKVFREALKQANLEPFAPASMEEVSWQPLVMKVRVPLEPVVELGDYRALRLESSPVEVTEEGVDQELAAIQEKYASWETVERPARIGDQVVLSLRSEVDGDVLSRENVTVLVRDPNDDPKYAAVLNALIGMSSGEECSTTIPFAPPSEEEEEPGEGKKSGDEETEPRGADAELNVWIKVHAVQEKHLYPLDDEFAQMVGDFDTIQDLREKVRAALIEKKQKEIERQQTAQTVERIVSEMSRVEWPPVLEELAIDRWVSGLEQRLKQQGMPLQAYLRTQQKSLEQLREEIRPHVQQQLRRSLVLQEIARREGISVEPDEVLRYIELMAAAGDQQNVLPSTLSRETARQIFQDLLDAKVYIRLSEILKGEVQEAAAEPTAETQESVESPNEISGVSSEAPAE
ncbi:MAG: trigger factor [Anaerolineae bacterium]